MLAGAQRAKLEHPSSGLALGSATFSPKGRRKTSRQTIARRAPVKIKDVKTFVVGNPPPQTGGRYFIFVKLTTDGGVVGY